jgi:hypothetical protein
MRLLMQYINLHAWLNEHIVVILILAVLIGFIPESGPHLVFVTMFAENVLPFSVLLTSSISQDGHGMLPLLAESKRGFLMVKIINGIFAMFSGFIWYLIESVINI